MRNNLAILTTAVVLICGIESRHIHAQALLAKLDSVSNSHIDEDSLQTDIKRFNKNLDSLNNFKHQPVLYAQKLDSCYKTFRQRILDRFSHRKDSLGGKLDRRVARIDSALQAKSTVLDSLMKNGGIDGVSAEQLTEKLNPSIADLDVPGIPAASSRTGLELPTVPGPSFKKPELSTEVNGLGKLSNELDQLKDLKDQAGDIAKISSEVEKVQKMDSETLEKTSERQLHKIDEINELDAETKKVDALEKQTNSLEKFKNSPDSAKTVMKREFVDHFAGKEDKVKNDLDNIAKLQLKYRTFGDSRLLPKRPPNPMKGKPFVERLIPGVTFQIFTQENVSVDVAPFIGYRFSGKLNAGVGAYKRITYFSENDHLQGVDCYGIRVFGGYKVIRKFNLYSEIEYYKNYTRNNILYGQLVGDSHWKWNVGIHKRYSIGKHFYGHFVVMYDLLKIKRFPNTEGGGVRFGLDYQIKKNKKKQKFS